MPHVIEKYRIFVASPSDVKDERESLNDVIQELNATYAHPKNLVLELVKWETHSAPAVSNIHKQDIIDSDIGNDYDLFIGILWKKFGTETIQFASGTEQEFHNAYSRFKTNPKALQILFYFKTSSPISLKDIDPIQLERVNNFKREIDGKGVLYWEYNTVDELQKFLRIHIPKRLDELISLNKTDFSSQNIILNSSITNGLDNEELGLIDYQEIIIESYADSTEALLRIAVATEWVGSEINKKTAELNRLKSRKQTLSNKEVRDFCRRTSDIMNTFASRLEPEIPLYFVGFEKGTDALSRMITIYNSDFVTNDSSRFQENIDTINTILSSIETALTSMKSFLESVSALPRMEKQLNKSRNNVETKLKEFINKLEISKTIVQELYKVIPKGN